MLSFRKRWQSIDRKLPLVASGLVVLTVVVLATTAHVLFERALLEAAGRRLFATTQVLVGMVQRPSVRITDTAALAADRRLRAFVRGRAPELSRDDAVRALGMPSSAADTIKYYAALVAPNGDVLLEYRRVEDTTGNAPRWAPSAIARGEIRGDTMSVGPIELVAGMPGVTLVRPVNDTTAPGVVRRRGYIVESRILSSNRNAARFRSVIGPDVGLIVGQPGVGVWTDLEHVAAAPPMRVSSDSIVVYPGGIAATARVPGLGWMVWLSQPATTVLAPARTLLWSTIPIGLAIAIVGAAIMWMVTRGITHPIVQLTDAAENVARDNGASGLQPTVHIPPDADEIARLRYAFERMAQRVAERQTLELQLRHAQKMEAVGRLAGGIAHDFNNLLTAIRSYADLMLDDMPAWDPKRSDALEIRNAATRAAALTAQLLAFSRKQMLQPKVLDTGAVLTEVKGMLQRLLIEEIKLVVDVPRGLWEVCADRGQLEQVIVNLAVNSRDAMPHGGLLHISAVNDVVLDAIATHDGEIPPGDYIVIRVSDSGIGMDAATQARAFEPFFTTKPTGAGTGLGLSTVHGIVHQSGGYVTIESAPQQGTIIAVYLPRVRTQKDSDTRIEGGDVAQRASGTSGGGGNAETVLIVEDELSVRSLARRVLEKTGYKVLEASSPTDALRLAQAHANGVHLIVSDVVMPEMNGPALVARALEHCPDAKVLFISGYADEDVLGRGIASGMSLLQKPFSAQELVERVSAILTAKSPARA